jgi:hypothetical protein
MKLKPAASPEAAGYLCSVMLMIRLDRKARVQVQSELARITSDRY